MGAIALKPRKLIGVNLPMVGPLSTQTWGGWGWTDVLAQLEMIQSLGVNCVRVHGWLSPVVGGTISLATYLSYWDSIIQVCDQFGLWVYPTGTIGYPAGNSSGSNVEAAFTNTNELAIIPAMVSYLANRRNVIGFDLMNEASAWSNSTDAANLYSACRGLTTLPLTFSGIATPSFPSNCDIIDVHNYSASPPNISTLQATYPGYDILLGEFGSPVSAGSTNQANWYFDSMTYTTASGGNIVGALAWALQDYDTLTTNQFGIFDESGTARGYLTAQMAGALSRVTVTPLPALPVPQRQTGYAPATQGFGTWGHK